MVRIKIFVSVETGLEEERLSIVDLVHCMNNIFSSFGFWFVVNSKCDEEYAEVIDKCDISLIVVCSDVDEESLMRKRIMDIRNNHKQNHLYVFFKEPITPVDKTSIVRNFQGHLEKYYGHFPVVKSIDEIRYEMLLRLQQFIAEHNKFFISDKISEEKATIRVLGTNVLLGEEIIADKSNISFFAAEKECNKIEEQLQSYQEQLENPNLSDNVKEELRLKIFDLQERLADRNNEIISITTTLVGKLSSLNKAVYRQAYYLLSQGDIDKCKELVDNYLFSVLDSSDKLYEESKENLKSLISLLELRCACVSNEEEALNIIETSYNKIIEIANNTSCEYAEKIQIYEDYDEILRKREPILYSSEKVQTIRKKIWHDAYHLCKHWEIDSIGEAFKTKARIIGKWGALEYECHNYKEAEKMLEEARLSFNDDLLSDEKDFTIQSYLADIIITLGRTHQAIAAQARGANVRYDYLDKAVKEYKEALTTATSFNDYQLQSFILAVMGELYRNNYDNKLDLSLSYHEQSYNLIKLHSSDKVQLAKQCINIGATYATIAEISKYPSKGSMQHAIDYYKEALDLINLSDDYKLQEKSYYTGIIHNNLGNSYRFLFKISSDENSKKQYFLQSREYYEKAYKYRYPLACYRSHKYINQLINTIDGYSTLLEVYIINSVKTSLSEDVKVDTDVKSSIENCEFMSKRAYEILPDGESDIKKANFLCILYLLSVASSIIDKDPSKVIDKYYCDAKNILIKEHAIDGKIAKMLENCKQLAVLFFAKFIWQ